MLTNDEIEALKELKANGYSFSDAMGFIASTRLGNTSKVERSLTQPTQEPQQPSDAVSDIKRGFTQAQQSFEEGMTRTSEASKRKTLLGRTSGQLGAGFRFAGDALTNIGSGLIRALPYGTEAMNAIEGGIGSGIQKASQSSTGQAAQDLYGQLPQGVKNVASDVGNVIVGGLGIAGALTLPSASTAFKQGVTDFVSSGVKNFGVNGIREAGINGLSPENLMQRVARISKGKQAAFESRAGESVGEYLVRRGIFGDPEEITTQLYRRMQDSKGRVDDGLSKVGGQYKNNAVADALDQLAEREARVSTARTPSPDSARVNELLKKHKREGLTLSEVNEVKRLYERNVKLDYLRDNVSDKIAQANNIDSKLRGFVEETASKNGFKNVKALNKETSLAKQLLDDLGAEYAGQQGNNFISLSDAMFLAEAASNPSALAAFGLKKILSGKGTMAAVAKLINGKRPTTGLPTAQIDLPKLPAPEGPITRVPEAQTIPLQSTTATARDIAERQNPNIKAPTGTGEAPLSKQFVDATDEATSNVRAEMLDIAQAGQRIILPHDAAAETNVIAAPSTFPKWVPEELRSKDLFTRVWNHIDNNTFPKTNAVKEVELYGLIKEQIQRREFDILAKENNWTNNSGGLLKIDDIPFSLLMATGAAAAAYYISDNDSSIMPMLVMGTLFRLTPKKRLSLINGQLERLSIMEKKLISSGSKYSDANVKSLIAARKKLIAERDSLPSE